MKNFFDPVVRSATLDRLDGLRPDSPRQWGRMTPGQTVCHLADAFQAALGDRPAKPIPNLMLSTVGRVIALSTPMPWPKGVKTAPEFDQDVAGTTPGIFQEDLDAMKGLAERFAATHGAGLQAHIVFGALTKAEWGRWAFRHLDHHLRQFGA